MQKPSRKAQAQANSKTILDLARGHEILEQSLKMHPRHSFLRRFISFSSSFPMIFIDFLGFSMVFEHLRLLGQGPRGDGPGVGSGAPAARCARPLGAGLGGGPPRVPELPRLGFKAFQGLSRPFECREGLEII